MPITLHFTEARQWTPGTILPNVYQGTWDNTAFAFRKGNTGNGFPLWSGWWVLYQGEEVVAVLIDADFQAAKQI